MQIVVQWQCHNRHPCRPWRPRISWAKIWPLYFSQHAMYGWVTFCLQIKVILDLLKTKLCEYGNRDYIYRIHIHKNCSIDELITRNHVQNPYIFFYRKEKRKTKKSKKSKTKEKRKIEPLTDFYPSLPQVSIPKNPSSFAVFAAIRNTCLENKRKQDTILQVSFDKSISDDIIPLVLLSRVKFIGFKVQYTVCDIILYPPVKSYVVKWP